jgi:hypothetical protein
LIPSPATISEIGCTTGCTTGCTNRCATACTAGCSGSSADCRKRREQNSSTLELTVSCKLYWLVVTKTRDPDRFCINSNTLSSVYSEEHNRQTGSGKKKFWRRCCSSLITIINKVTVTIMIATLDLQDAIPLHFQRHHSTSTSSQSCVLPTVHKPNRAASTAVTVSPQSSRRTYRSSRLSSSSR